MDFLYPFLKKIAFQLDPESVHHLTFKILQNYPQTSSKLFTNKLPITSRYRLKTNSGNWNFPLGLAAGLDKNATAIDFFSNIGFGAIEVGTVTPLAQPGNSKPRLFRLLNEESLLNRMGFNNDGAEIVKRNIQRSINSNGIFGINLGKNKITPLEMAWKDYLSLYESFSPLANYLVINVSSPNTPGLRDLQSENNLREILNALENIRKESPVPLYLKISPDLDKKDVISICELAKIFNLAGIIATNTTRMPEKGEGGISGKLLLERSKEIREIVLDVLRESNLDIIGVGGISHINDLIDFWKKGGKVMQIYTAFIYQGPRILKVFQKEIDKLLDKYQLENLENLLKNINKIG